MPEDKFQQALAAPGKKPSTAGIIREHTEPKVTPVSDEAVWVCGRLKDFERNGLLARDPNEVLSTAIPTMMH